MPKNSEGSYEQRIDLETKGMDRLLIIIDMACTPSKRCPDFKVKTVAAYHSFVVSVVSRLKMMTSENYGTSYLRNDLICTEQPARLLKRTSRAHDAYQHNILGFCRD